MLEFLKVEGHSLTPILIEGDYVLIIKRKLFSLIYRQGLQSGDFIVFTKPGYPKMIKRIKSVHKEGFEVEGTHIDSVSSRQFGLVQRHETVGKVILSIRDFKFSVPASWLRPYP